MNKKWLMGFTAAMFIAAFAAPFAASSPDGLERVAQDQGFNDKETNYISSPIPGYSVPGMGKTGVSTAMAGITGTAVTFGIMYGFTKLVVTRRKQTGESA